ncbi:MAG: UDP-glucose/GDP-mannose dehydrogenase family protein, partial [Acidobacteria bacterium]|nr:UDP-glucose/GDP-mannose dehydrogenase family protein [Acidobacteriota bacterium]
MKIAIFGLGYVGSVTGACLAELGHTVCGVDRDGFKVDSIRRGKAPFYEPGLEELIQKHAAAGRLSATSNAAEALDGADVAILCVGTPSERNGNLGLGQMRRACEEISSEIGNRAKRLIVTIRSTVFPGTCRDVVMPALGTANVAVVANPEFLREGTAVKDFMEPALVVVGGDDRGAVETVAALYAPLEAETALVSLGTAEMIKYACNAFHAVKISFANEIGAVCGKLDIPAVEVMQTLCKDTKLNASAAYLKPGFAFGGSCLPKDLRALNYRSLHLDLSLPMLDSILDSNARHLSRAVQAVLDLPGKKTGIFGLSFKENTDDLRESPVVVLLEQLIGKGADVRIFDPYIRIEDIYGSNRNYIMESIPHIGLWFSQTPKLLINWGLPFFLRFPCSPPLVALAAAFLAFFRQRAALQLEILALRHQLGVLQRSVQRPKLTAADRFLWALLAAVWTDWQLSSIMIKPATVIGWHRKGFRLFWTWKIRRGRPGRPAVPADVRSLIRAMSRDNPLWGAPRIHGELLKLGISVGETSVSKYMVRNRKPPSQTWRTFLENHVKTMVSVDF